MRKYLVDSQSAKSEFIEKRVKILKAARAHEGLYQCIANNSIGTVMKNAQVRVLLSVSQDIAKWVAVISAEVLFKMLPSVEVLLKVEVISRTVVRIASSTEEGNPDISVQVIILIMLMMLW